jgi:hypothetical protein
MRWHLMVLIVVCSFISAGQDRKTLDVCDIVKNIEALNGNAIAVRGAIMGRGMMMVGEECREHIVIKGWEFRDGIQIWPTNIDPRIALHKFDFVAPEEFDKLKRLYKLAEAKGRHLVCVCTGMVETRTPIDRLAVRSDWPFGFGTDGRMPFQMILKSVDSCEERSGEIKVNEGGPTKLKDAIEKQPR